MDISVALFTCSTLTCVSSLLGSNVVIESERSWIEANNFCKTHYGGKVVSGDEAYNVEADISALESFWTRDLGVLTKWFTILGCYQRSSEEYGDVLRTKIYNDNIMGRCARHCLKNSTRYFALQNTTCFCLSDVTSSKVDPFRCDLSCDGNNEHYLCGGPNFYTVYKEARQTPNARVTCAADPTKCNCMAAQCLSSDVEYYSENCSSSLAASCNEGGFRYIVNNGRTQNESWYNMLDLCISGRVNGAPSSYLDSLEDRAAKNLHCNGNQYNPNSVWTSTIRKFLPLSDDDTFDEVDENIACSYCIQSRGKLSCQNYYSGRLFCLNPSSQLQFICKYDSSERRSTHSVSTSVSTSRSTELLISKSTTKKASTSRSTELLMSKSTTPKDMTLVLTASSAAVGVIVLVSMIILLFVYRRRKMYFQRKREMERRKESKSADNVQEVDKKEKHQTFENGNLSTSKYSHVNDKDGTSSRIIGEAMEAFSYSYENGTPSLYMHEVNNGKQTQIKSSARPSGDSIYDHSGNGGNPCAETSSNYDHLQLSKKSTTHTCSNTDYDDRVYSSTGTGNDVYDHTHENKGYDAVSSEYYDHVNLSRDQAQVYDTFDSSIKSLTGRQIISDENLYDGTS